MPRDRSKKRYYTIGVDLDSRQYAMIEAGAGGKTGADFVLMLVDDVDKLLHGEPAVILSGLLAAAKLTLQTHAVGTSPLEEVSAPPPAPPPPVSAALARVALAKRSKMYNDDDED